MAATCELVAVDTVCSGTLKGVGKVYIQTMLECFSRFVLGPALHLEEERSVKVQAILGDNRRE